MPARKPRFQAAVGARDHTIFGGRLPLEPEGFVETAMVNGTPEESRDLRDWDEIRAWSARIGAELAAER